MITIVIKEPGKSPYSKEIEDDLEVYHQILGGYFEAVGFDKNQILVVTISGRGDKDVAAIARYRGVEIFD